MLAPPVSTRDKLLRAAMGIVARDGLAAATTSAIAAQAQVAEGTLYRHFPSKDDLLIEAYRQLKAGILSEATQALNDAAPLGERLKALWLGLYRAYQADADAFAFGQRFKESALARREGGAAHEAIVSTLVRLRDEGVEAGLLKDLPADLMMNLFLAPVSYLLQTELKGRRWTDAELDAAAQAALDALLV